MKKVLSLLTFCWLLVMTMQSYAQEEKGSREVSATMEEVVVTATKTQEKRGDIPNAVIIKDEYDIRESPAESLGDLLANELGIDWRTYGNYGGASQEIQIRGMGGDGTQVLINGLNINSPSLGVADIGKIPLNSIEKIEVVKGAGSLLYGSGAMGGTINIITKRPRRDKKILMASAGYGSGKTYNLAAENGMFLNDDFGYYLTANRRETDGFRSNSDLIQNDVTMNLVLDKGDNLNMSLYADYVDRENGQPGVKPPAGTKDFSFSGIQLYNSESADLLDRAGDKEMHLVLDVKSKRSESIAFNLNCNYLDSEHFDYNRYYNNFPAPALPGTKTWVTNRVLSIEGNTNYTPSNTLELLIGGEYKDYRWENETATLDNSGEEVAGLRTNSVAGLNSHGIFSELQYKPIGYLKGLIGVRKERHSAFGSEILPRFGLVINPRENTSLKLSRGKHFNAPTPNDLFWPFEDWGFGMGAQGNSGLMPETGWHTDATIEQSSRDNMLFFTLSYFKWDLKNKIRWVPDAFFFYMPENLDDYEADGWEIGTRIGPVGNFEFSIFYTGIDAIEHRKGGASRRAQYTPESQFKGNVVYWMDSGLTANITVRYISDRPAQYANEKDTQPSKTLKSYWTTDVKLENPINDHFSISLVGRNLFNEQYDTYASSFRNNDTGVTTIEGYPGTGRSLFLNVTYEY